VEVSLLTLCPLGQPNKAVGHESQIEPWLTHIAQPFCLMAFQKSTESTQHLSRFGEKHRAVGKEWNQRPTKASVAHQAAGLLQGMIEKAGIATVSISLLLDVTKRIEPPRVLAVDKPLGYPLGEPNNADLQNRILLAALNLLPCAVAEPLIVAFPIE